MNMGPQKKMNDSWWRYENLDSGAPYDWSPATKGNKPDDQIDFHVDLGAGKVPKGRLSIDRHGDVDISMNLDTLEIYKTRADSTKLHPVPQWGLWNKMGGGFPFDNDSIESIISHHCLEHIGNGFISLMDECYRVLKPGGIFRIIVPLFPSLSAVTDPDHKRYFTKETLQSFVHRADEDTPFWTDSFSEPYTKCRFSDFRQEYTPAPEILSGFTIDHFFEEPRELRASLIK